MIVEVRFSIAGKRRRRRCSLRFRRRVRRRRGRKVGGDVVVLLCFENAGESTGIKCFGRRIIVGNRRRRRSCWAIRVVLRDPITRGRPGLQPGNDPGLILKT